MNVYNRSLFKDRANEARDALREMGGVGNKMPRGILASSPELMQAAMPARQPTAPMQQAQPMPRPASANLPPASPIPDIAGTQAVRQAQPGAVARPPVAQPMMQRPMPQGNPMSGSLQNKPGFAGGGQLNFGGHNAQDYIQSGENFSSIGPQSRANQAKSGTLRIAPDNKGGSSQLPRGGSGVRTAAPAPDNVPMSFSELFKLGDDLVNTPVDENTAPHVQETLLKIEEVKKKTKKEDLVEEVKKTIPDVPEKVLAAMEVDEALKILAGAELAKAIAGNVTNQQTGEVIRETAGARMAGGAERAAKARLTVEMGREQNELDRKKAESVAKIQAGKGTGLKLKDELDIFVKLFEEERNLRGKNTESALAAMQKHHPNLTERFLTYSGGQLPGTGGTETNPAINVGDTRDGFRFKGGDPSNELNWEKVS